MEKIRVLLVDDHPAIGDALAYVVRDEPRIELIGQAATADEGMSLARETNPDVLIVEISLGDAHGLDFVQNLKIQLPDVRVVVFSKYDENIYAERSLRAGAMGYLMKTEPTQHVVDAIRTVVDGDVYLSSSMASQILSRMSLGQSPEAIFAVDELTDRELQVFQMLGDGSGVDKISDKLKLSRKTVETYRRRAKEKLGLATTDELLHYAIEWRHSTSTGGPEAS